MKPKSLLRSTAIVSAMTFLSRILGFARDMLVAHFFGAGAAMDAFLVAFKIPNFLRRLFAEGAFAQAFVPVLGEYKHQKTLAEVRSFVQHMSASLGLVLLLLTLVAILTTPWLVKVFAPGFTEGSERMVWATAMLKITFPYLFFIAMTAFAGGVLNTYQRFAIPAITPVLLNLCMIGAALVFMPYFEPSIYALAWGVFLGGLVQLLFQLPFLHRLGFLHWPKLKWRDPAVRKVIRLMVPALLGVSVAQISLLMDTFFASFLPTGSISWLYYSERLMTFPLGVFGVALATVILPALSQKHAAKSAQAYSNTLDWALRCVMLISIPAATGLAIMAGPLLTTLFQYGAFDDHAVRMARESLWAFALGIPGFMLIKVLASGFYATQNIKTPVRIAMVALAANMGLNLALILPLQHAGLALATSLSSALNAMLLYWGLRQRKVFMAEAGWGKFMGKVVLANAAMGGSLLWLSPQLGQWLSWSLWPRLMVLTLLLGMAILVYGGALLALGLRLSMLRQNAAL